MVDVRRRHENTGTAHQVDFTTPPQQAAGPAAPFRVVTKIPFLVVTRARNKENVGAGSTSAIARTVRLAGLVGALRMGPKTDQSSGDGSCGKGEDCDGTKIQRFRGEHGPVAPCDERANS